VGARIHAAAKHTMQITSRSKRPPESALPLSTLTHTTYHRVPHAARWYPHQVKPSGASAPGSWAVACIDPVAGRLSALVSCRGAAGTCTRFGLGGGMFAVHPQPRTPLHACAPVCLFVLVSICSCMRLSAHVTVSIRMFVHVSVCSCMRLSVCISMGVIFSGACRQQRVPRRLHYRRDPDRSPQGSGGGRDSHHPVGLPPQLLPQRDGRPRGGGGGVPAIPAVGVSGACRGASLQR